MKKCISLFMLIGFFGYKLYSQTAILETFKKDSYSTTQVTKIDSVEINDTKVFLTPGYHVVEIHTKYTHELFIRMFKTDEFKYILSMKAEKDKKYIMESTMKTFVDSRDGIIRFNELTIGIVEKKGGLCVSESIIPKEFKPFQESDGTIHCYYSSNKISTDSLALIKMRFTGENDFNMGGWSKDGQKVQLSEIDIKGKNDYFFRPGYYYVDYTINNGRGIFFFKLSKSDDLRLIFTPVDCAIDKNTLASVKLNNIFFLPDGIHGWIVGDNGMILKTDDGGNNWEFFQFKKKIQEISDPYKEYTNLFLSLRSLFFINNMEGWAVGQKGIVIHSTDGGKNWMEQNSNETEELFNNVIFLNEKEGFITPDYYANNTSTTWKFITNNRLKHTIDGGLTWNTLEDPKQDHPYYYVFDKNNVWKMFDDGLFFSKDMTSTWTNSGLKYDYSTTIPKNGSNYDFAAVREYYYNIFFINPLCGWSIVNNLKHTVDGGKTWTDQCENFFSPNSLFFIDENTGWAISMDRGAIFKTMDAGKNWNMLQETKDFKDKLTDVYFINKEIGWAVGGNGFIYQSKDGGINWTSSHILDCTNL